MNERAEQKTSLSTDEQGGRHGCEQFSHSAAQMAGRAGLVINGPGQSSGCDSARPPARDSRVGAGHVYAATACLAAAGFTAATLSSTAWRISSSFTCGQRQAGGKACVQARRQAPCQGSMTGRLHETRPCWAPAQARLLPHGVHPYPPSAPAQRMPPRACMHGRAHLCHCGVRVDVELEVAQREAHVHCV